MRYSRVHINRAHSNACEEGSRVQCRGKNHDARCGRVHTKKLTDSALLKMRAAGLLSLSSSALICSRVLLPNARRCSLQGDRSGALLKMMDGVKREGKITHYLPHPVRVPIEMWTGTHTSTVPARRIENHSAVHTKDGNTRTNYVDTRSVAQQGTCSLFVTKTEEKNCRNRNPITACCTCTAMPTQKRITNSDIVKRVTSWGSVPGRSG